MIAKAGPIKKEGKIRHYRFPSPEFIGQYITWTHPPGNDIMYADIVGEFRNPRFTDGKLIVDMDINDSKMTPAKWNYLKEHPDASLGYYYTEHEADGRIYRDIKKINHIAIGIEEGVCSTPTCGLATAADSHNKQLIYATDSIKDVIKLENTQLKPNLELFLEKDKQLAALQKEIAALKAASDEKEKAIKCLKETTQAYEERERKQLVQQLVERTGQDAQKFEGKTLAMLKEFQALLPEQKPAPAKTTGIVLDSGTDQTGKHPKATITPYGYKWVNQQLVRDENAPRFQQ